MTIQTFSVGSAGINNVYTVKTFQSTKMRRLYAVLVTLFIGLVANVATGTEPNDLPTKSLILGVPYVGWQEALQLEYSDKNVLNPAVPASWGMILKYWGRKLAELEKKEESPFKEWVLEDIDLTSLDELKSFIARGIPVMVNLPLTEVAHPLYFIHILMVSEKGGEIPSKEGHCSGLAGNLGSLDTFHRIRQFLSQNDINTNPFNESLYAAPRVLIGYDDERRVVILHDPSFGPAWEVSYNTFYTMLGAVGNRHTIYYPPDYKQKLRQRIYSDPYRNKTANELAAFYYVYGCALSAAGDFGSAEEHFKTGLAVPGLGTGYRHMLLYELARHQDARGATEEAFVTINEAIDILPENTYPWEFLADLYKKSGIAGHTKEEKKARKKAKRLAEQNRATRKVAQTLPSDFWIQPLAQFRGWGNPPATKDKPSPTLDDWE